MACQHIYVGKPYSEWKKLKGSETQPVGGEEHELADNEVLLDGVVYVIKNK